VLTDLYVQTSKHTIDEERQFIELTSRLIERGRRRDPCRGAARGLRSIRPRPPKR